MMVYEKRAVGLIGKIPRFWALYQGSIGCTGSPSARTFQVVKVSRIKKRRTVTLVDTMNP